MDVTKLTSLIFAIAALIGAVTSLIGALRPPGESPAPVNSPPATSEKSQLATNSERPDTRSRPGVNTFDNNGDEPIRRARRIRAILFTIAGVCLVASVTLFAFFLIRPEPFKVAITNPPNGPVDVTTAVSSETGKNTGDGTIPLAGTYSGALTQNNLQIFLAARVAGKPEGHWYVEVDRANITRETAWFRPGTWSLKEKYLGRGEPDHPIQPGEQWELQALIAPGSQPPGIETTDQLRDVKAKSEVITIRINSVLPHQDRAN